MKIKIFTKLCEVGISSRYDLHDKIQFRLLLNILLACKFNLQPYLTAEGGITGPDVNLINSRSLIIGLQKDTDLPQTISIKEKQILEWYEKILKIVFIEGSVGFIIPGDLWIDDNQKTNYQERFNLLLKSIIFSDWNATIEEKVNFVYKTYLPKIKYFLDDHLYKDEFLPLRERAFLLSL